ncbi:hypothetical protein BGZ98_003021, partial [Dissophora globulifera]
MVNARKNQQTGPQKGMTNHDRELGSSSSIPYCCISAYETAENVLQNGNSDYGLKSCAIRLHYITFAFKDVQTIVSPRMATLLSTSGEEDELQQFMDAAQRLR